jgi:hypothetical protein
VTVVYDTDEDGNIAVVFDSRWRFPELLGYSPEDSQYKALQRLWEDATGKTIEEDKCDGKSEQRKRENK